MYYTKEPELTGRIVTPKDTQYNVDRQDFNTFFSKFPLVIMYAQETQDVVNAVKWARYWKVPMRIRSGGHSYEAFSLLNAGIVIDLSEMTQVDIEYKRQTVIAQTGLRNKALYKTLGAEGLVVPSGICPTPAIGGVTLGGGHSILSRPWGLTLDNLLELEMVDANGKLIRASNNQNTDLFWASRGGGGGNFGICTSFRFRTHSIDTVGFAEISWDIKDLKPVLKAWQEYTTLSADERLTPTLFIASGEMSSLLMQGVFLGSAKELRGLLQPLLCAASPKKATIEEIPWVEAAELTAAPQPGTPLPFKSVGPYLYHLLPEQGIATIERFIKEAPEDSTVSVFLHGLGGAVAKVPSWATAYIYRNALSNMSLFATWTKPEGAATCIHWVEVFRQAMLPFTRGVYVNTPDTSIEDWQDAYYATNFKRLTQVKTKYDPENIFRFQQSIPPSII
jgi:FAD/FMN-containing dehydrogenase